MDSIQKKKLLDKVASEIAASKGGPLKDTGINPVPGEGNPDADLMFIGEAPGFNENEQKRPFVGQAGKLLRKTLVLNGWKEDEVYITNIVKFRPPENRDPTPAEIEYFKPYLDKQIEIIDPKIIVTLGRYSMYKFLGEGASISRIHGRVRSITWQGRKILIFPMFHPAAALRTGAILEEFEEDFKKLRELTDDGISTDSLQISTNSDRDSGDKRKEEIKQLQLI